MSDWASRSFNTQQACTLLNALLCRSRSCVLWALRRPCVPRDLHGLFNWTNFLSRQRAARLDGPTDFIYRRNLFFDPCRIRFAASPEHNPLKSRRPTDFCPPWSTKCKLAPSISPDIDKLQGMLKRFRIGSGIL